MIEQAKWDEARMRSQNEYLDQHRLTIIIIKDPLLAIRYQLPDGHIRKLQLNFRSDEGFKYVVETLRLLPLPIKRQPDRIRPQSAVSSLQGPSMSMGSSQGSQTPMLSNHYKPVQLMHPNPDYGQRAMTSYAINDTPLSSAPEALERPFTAPTVTSQMLPPTRQLPFGPSKPKYTPSSSIDTNQNSTAMDKSKKQHQTKASAKPKPNTPRKLKAPRRTDKGKPVSPPMVVDTPSHKDAKAQAEGDDVSWSPPPSAQPQRDNSGVYSQPCGNESALPSQQCPGVLLEPPVPIGIAMTTITPDNEILDKEQRPTPSWSPPKYESPSKGYLTPMNSSHSPVRSPSAIENLSLEELMSRMDSWLRLYRNGTVTDVAPGCSTSLADYTAKADDERLTTMDNLICSCLEDENFVKFAEEWYESWTRIGLGS